MDAISQTTFSNAFSWIKMFEFRLKFHWSLFPGVQLTIFQQWFRLSEPMMVSLPTHICVARPQWVKTIIGRVYLAFGGWYLLWSLFKVIVWLILDSVNFWTTRFVGKAFVFDYIGLQILQMFDHRINLFPHLLTQICEFIHSLHCNAILAFSHERFCAAVCA